MNPTYPNAGANYQVDDANPDARYLRGLVTLVVRRVLAGIPNVVDRWNFAYGRLWTDEEIVAYLAAYPDADAILERWLGAEGLKLLRAAQPRLYRLLVVPLPGEAPQPDGPPSQAGAELGNAPTDYALNATATDSNVALHPTFVDPDASSNPDGIYGVKVDWGDGRVEGYVLFRDAPESQVLEHAYAVAGSYTVRSWVVNASGLRATRNEEITVVQGTGAAEAPSISQINLDLVGRISVASGYGSIANPGVFAIDVAAVDGQDVTRFVGRYWVKPPVPSGHGSGDRPSTFHSVLRLVPGGDGRDPLRLSLADDVGNELVGHEADALDSRSTRSRVGRDCRGHGHVRPEQRGSAHLPDRHDDARRSAPRSRERQARHPGPRRGGRHRDPDERHARPADGVRLRPTYGTAPAAMVTAGGGCRDLSTGLVWSLQSAQKESWNDAVWDSALAGNDSPDASDYGRLNDYPGQYRSPDPTPRRSTTAIPSCRAATTTGASRRRRSSRPSSARAGPWTTSPRARPTRRDLEQLGRDPRNHPEPCGREPRVRREDRCQRAGGLRPLGATACDARLQGPERRWDHVRQRSGRLPHTRAGGLVEQGERRPEDLGPGGLGLRARRQCAARRERRRRAERLRGRDGARRPGCLARELLPRARRGWLRRLALPTSAELLAVSGASLAASYFAFETGEAFHSSSSWDTTNAIAKSLEDGSTSYSSEHTKLARVVCVRRAYAPDPAALPGAPGTPTSVGGGHLAARELDGGRQRDLLQGRARRRRGRRSGNVAPGRGGGHGDVPLRLEQERERPCTGTASGHQRRGDGPRSGQSSSSRPRGRRARRRSRASDRTP